MIGSIGRHIIAVGGSALRREVERKITLTEEGGYSKYGSCRIG